MVVELESSANVRFLHARAEAKSLSAIAGLGGAGAGGAADEAHYLWPKFAAGMTYNSSFVDSMFGQAFYRPSRFVCSVLCCIFASRASCARFVPSWRTPGFLETRLTFTCFLAVEGDAFVLRSRVWDWRKRPPSPLRQPETHACLLGYLDGEVPDVSRLLVGAFDMTPVVLQLT